MHTAQDHTERTMTGEGFGAWRFLLVACALLFIAIMASCGGEKSSQPIERPSITGVTVEAVAPAAVDEVFEAAGTVKSDRTSTIASRVMGTITSVKVRAGDRVEAGQLLMTIDDRDASARSRAASMALESTRQNRDLADKTWRRYRSLFEQKALSHQEMDQIDTQRKVAEAEYSRARAMADEAGTFLGFTRITSPVPGRVTAKLIDTGSMAAPGMPLLTIEGGGEMYVETAVDESLTSRVKTGMTALVDVESLGRSLSGTIREVVPAVDPASRTFIVKVTISGEDIRSGLFTRVRIPLGRRPTILVPESSIVTKGQLTGVYAVDEQGVVTYRLIRTGKRYPNGMEVLSGLSPSERIITGSVDNAIDGGIIAPETKR
jgi:RND family efflux transporter MFP subunit